MEDGRAFWESLQAQHTDAAFLRGRTRGTVHVGTDSSPRSEVQGSIWQEAQTCFHSEPHTDQSDVAALSSQLK